jgi:hypothetical protein
LVQAIVKRSDWQSGNALAFVIRGTGKRVAEAYNGEPDSAPELVIEYSTSTTVKSLDARISAGADDAEEGSSGTMSLTGSDLELVLDASQQVVGLRFVGLNIPQGVTISNAYLQFKVDEVSTAATTLSLQTQTADSAPAFSYSSSNLSSRSRSSAATTWTVASWPTIAEASTAQRSPNLSAIIQEVISRPGWRAGNSLVIIITGSGKRVAESFEGDAAAAPLLHIDWQ